MLPILLVLAVACGAPSGGMPAAGEQPAASGTTQGTDPLPTWNDGPRKQAITEFVEAVTTPGGADFVTEAERIATFDNDGTLWVEHPMYTQLAFAFDRVHELAPQHSDWATTEPFKSVLDNNIEGVAAAGKKGLVELVMATHAGMTTGEFAGIVTQWIGTAQHPRFQRVYTELVYQPMVELLAYLQDNGFKTYIVSGGGVEFMRPWTEATYNIPPEQVIGSTIKTRFEMRDGEPVLVREPEVFFINDEEGKPIDIEAFIGRRPIAAFGNSDHDIPMLQWTLAGDGRRLAMMVHHTDADREYAYDRDTSFGALGKGIDDAASAGWQLIDMKNDWARIFAWEQ
jgi:phosphoserine phosphatase